MNQDLRSFIWAFQEEFPKDVIQASKPVDLKYDVMALVLEYEKRRRMPVLH